MEGNNFSLFPPIGAKPTEDINSSVLESYESDSKEYDNIINNKNIELNKEAPGLFPPMHGEISNSHVNFAERSSLNTSEVDSFGKSEIEEDVFNVDSSTTDISANGGQETVDMVKFQQQVIEKLPKDYDTQLINDKYFLTKLYKNTDTVQFQDFEAYDGLLRLEDKLRETLFNINNSNKRNSNNINQNNNNNKEHRQSDANQGLNIPIIAEEGLNDLYLYSREPDIRFFENLKRQKQRTNILANLKRKLLKNKKSKHEKKINSGNEYDIELGSGMELERVGSAPTTVYLDESQSLTKRPSIMLHNKLNNHTNANIDEKLNRDLDSSDYIGSLNNLEKDKINGFGFDSDADLFNKKTNVLNSNNNNTELGFDYPHKKSEYTLQRKLRMRHLQMLSIGASIGIGLFLQSGKAISIAGGLGAWIGFFFAATLITSTLLCFGEIVALLPVTTGVTGIVHRFLNPSLSFSVSWVYLISYCLSVPSEILASSLLLSYFENAEKFLNDKGNMTLVLVLFSSFIIFINLMDVRVYAEFEYITSTVKIIVILAMIVFMIVLNTGGVSTTEQSSQYMGFRYWDSNKKFANEPTITLGPFRPTFDLKDIGFGAREGIKGFGGVILQIIAASSVAIYSYIGTEIGFIGAAESSVQLRRSISSVAKRIYIRVIVFYLVSIFLIAILIYSGDPRLLRYRNDSTDISSTPVNEQIDTVLKTLKLASCGTSWAQNNDIFDDSATQSPWIIMLSNFKLCKLAKGLDGIFVAIGICAASSQLYVSSRILHSMSIQDKAPKFFSKCNKHGVPYVAVLTCGAFSYLSLLGLHNKSVISLNRLVQMGTQGAVIMWFFINVAFLRFYYAVKSRPDLLDRDSKEYPYKSPLQPYLAYYGAGATLFLFLVSGFANFIEWQTIDFIVDYLSLAILIVLYISYQLIKRPKVFWDIEDINLDIGRKELDREIWQEDTEYMPTFKEVLKKILSYV